MWRETLKVRVWSIWNVPLLAWVRPRVTELTLHRAVVTIPLRRRTRNHLGSMYFGALCTGADCAGGIMAMRAIERSGKRVSLVFGEFHAEFLRRPSGDVQFVCDEGEAIAQLVARTIASGERETMPVRIDAFVEEAEGRMLVAKFTLALSLKSKG